MNLYQAMLFVAGFMLLASGAAPAQDVTKKEAVKTTKVAKDKTKKMKKEVRMEAEQTIDVVKRAKKEARKNN